jgi:hypothetical protein
MREQKYSYMYPELWQESEVSHQPHPGYMILGEIALGTHWIEGWVGCRAGMDVLEKRKFSCPCQASNCWIVQSIA